MPRFHFLLCAIALAACGQVPGADAPQAAQGVVAAAPASCEAPAQPAALGATVESELRATTAPYPANATYYCVSVPDGAQSLTLELGGLSADLDLYVAHGTIRTLQGADISGGENFQWKSNAFGNGDERVVIDAPQPGIYYVEIVSYEGNGSRFRLTAR